MGTKTTPQSACLNAADGSRGIISVVADRLGLSRNAVYNLMERYPAFKQAIHDEREKRKDRAELTLDSIITGHWVTDPSSDPKKPTRVYVPPNVTGLIFYLKTQARDRGYSEKQELELSGNVDITNHYESASQVFDSIVSETVKRPTETDVPSETNPRTKG